MIVNGPNVFRTSVVEGVSVDGNRVVVYIKDWVDSAVRHNYETKCEAQEAFKAICMELEREEQIQRTIRIPDNYVATRTE